jgi:hypothetical protein
VANLTTHQHWFSSSEPSSRSTILARWYALNVAGLQPVYLSNMLLHPKPWSFWIPRRRHVNRLHQVARRRHQLKSLLLLLLLLYPTTTTHKRMSWMVRKMRRQPSPILIRSKLLSKFTRSYRSERFARPHLLRTIWASARESCVISCASRGTDKTARRISRVCSS